jgi:hypothetical protein
METGLIGSAACQGLFSSVTAKREPLAAPLHHLIYASLHRLLVSYLTKFARKLRRAGGDGPLVVREYKLGPDRA